ncbi:SPOR domain-containing protein [Nakamurella flava]|uniref:SPOR domain-containing protein n=1 Tax=Nakamurella flava TaxID=2576308 RepID=A0A4U6QPC8_9ACTN|nr:SPOR domain-containing protein [Nakamurella flava]
MGQHTQFYYNVTTGQVEREGESKAKDLLGPYATAEEAANALQSVHDREARLNAEDREWRDG